MGCMGWVLVLLVATSVATIGAQGHSLNPVAKSMQPERSADAFTSFVQLSSRSVPAQAQGKPSPNKPRRIHGQIKLSGQKYKTTCDCHTDEAHTCHQPTRIRVHKEPISRIGLSRKQLRAMLGRPASFEVVDVKKTSLACLDGRNTQPVLGTPGGDFGELLNGLQVVEAVTGRNLTETECEQALQGYLRQLDGRMFYCTDEDAISVLQKNIKLHGRKGLVVGLKVDNPKNAHKEGLLSELPKEMHQGDYYLKAVLADPGKFYFRKQLVVDAIRALHKVLWDKTSVDEDGGKLRNKINFQVYEGEPKEKTWINFRGNSHCEREHRAPLFSPRNKVWANHPEAAATKRKALARYLLTVREMPLNQQSLWERLNRRGRRTMELYAESRALAVAPFYTVTVE